MDKHNDKLTTDSSLPRPVVLSPDDLNAVGGARGGETNNTNYYSECGGNGICMPNSTDTFIGETFKNQ